MNAVIIAGGLGQRLRPITSAIPKPLIPFGEKAMIELQIEYLKKYNFEDIYISTNYKADYMRNFLGDGSRYGVNLTIFEEKMRLGTAGPIKLLENILSEPFLVINSDIVSNLDLGELYRYATNISEIMTIGVKQIAIPTSYGNICAKDNRVISIDEKPDIFISAMSGIYVMKPEVMDYIPSDVYYGMDQLIQDILKREIGIATYDISGFWMDVGQYEDYEKVQNDYERLKDDKNE